MDVTQVVIPSTGHEQVDDLIRAVIGLFEAVFPERIRGYYLLGSYADGTSTSLSDLDLGVVFRGPFADEREAATARRLNQVLYTARFGSIRIDAAPRSEAALGPMDRVLLKLASTVVAGEDIRDQLTLPPINEYIQAVTGSAQYFCLRVLRQVEVVRVPVGYPDPTGDLYGYDRVRLSAWYPPQMQQGLKELVATVGRMATALIALQAGQFVARKPEAFRGYRRYIGDAWSGYLDAVYDGAVHWWGYRVPEEPAERATLRDLCRQTLAFENHFLARYRTYLVDELRQGGVGALTAAERAGQVLFPDAEMRAALHDLAAGPDAAIRRAALTAVQRLESG